MSAPADLEWDEVKRASNRERHDVDFAEIARLDWTSALVVEDDRQDYGERRFLLMGRIDGRLHVAVITPRGERFRVISLRKANRREEGRYGARS
jgi:uncharacterized protein